MELKLVYKLWKRKDGEDRGGGGETEKESEKPYFTF